MADTGFFDAEEVHPPSPDRQMGPAPLSDPPQSPIEQSAPPPLADQATPNDPPHDPDVQCDAPAVPRPLPEQTTPTHPPQNPDVQFDAPAVPPPLPVQPTIVDPPQNPNIHSEAPPDPPTLSEQSTLQPGNDEISVTRQGSTIRFSFNQHEMLNAHAQQVQQLLRAREEHRRLHPPPLPEQLTTTDPPQNENLHLEAPPGAPTLPEQPTPQPPNDGISVTRQGSTIHFGSSHQEMLNVHAQQVQQLLGVREEHRRSHQEAVERAAGLNSSNSNPQLGAEFPAAVAAPGVTVDSTAVPVPAATPRHPAASRVMFNNTPVSGLTIIRNSDGGQQVLMPQQVGAVHRTVRVPPGARHITIPVGAGNHIRIQGAGTQPHANNNPNVIPRVAIPRLMAQAILNSSRGVADEKDDEDDQHDKYRCTICYEFFADPSSCGKCASRFCHACLARVANTRSSSNPTSSKCPACRTVLTADDIVRDDALREELKAANLQVLCSFRGCNQRLAAATMKEHEQSCEFTPMRCKNATMGCSWKGVRKGLDHHLSSHCHVERVGGFVDQFRHSRADHQAAMISLQRNQTMSNQLSEINAGLMRRALPSPSNIFDLINLTYTASCTPAYFFFTADIWRMFLVQQGAQESRAAVCNLLYLLPTIFNVCRTAVGGYRLLLSLNMEQDVQMFADNMELGMLSVTPFLLLLTAGICFLIDGQSSMKWSSYKYFGMWDRKVMRDMATIAVLVINLVVIECDEAGMAAVFLWLCVITATCCFPPIILTILGSASGIPEPNPHQIFSAGRGATVVLFALRHSAVAAFLGILPAVDAAILMQLLRRNLTFVVRYDLVPVSDGIWTSIGSEFLFGFLVVRISMWAIETRFEDVPWLTIIASLAFPLINFLVHQLTLVGIKIGTLVYREGRSNVLPNQSGVRNAFSVYGTLAFCAWSSILLLLAVTF